MSSILDKTDHVRFSLKHNHPSRAEITFTKLGNTSMLFFLAPRAIETEIDDDDNDDLDDF